MKEAEALTHPGDFGRYARLVGAVSNIRGATGIIFVDEVQTGHRIEFVKGGIKGGGREILEQFGMVDPREMLRNLQKQDPCEPGKWRKVHVKRSDQEEKYEFFYYGDMLDIRYHNRELGSTVVLRFEFPEINY